jgi:hypothetical protein
VILRAIEAARMHLFAAMGLTRGETEGKKRRQENQFV